MRPQNPCDCGAAKFLNGHPRCEMDTKRMAKSLRSFVCVLFLLVVLIDLGLKHFRWRFVGSQHDRPALLEFYVLVYNLQYFCTEF